MCFVHFKVIELKSTQAIQATAKSAFIIYYGTISLHLPFAENLGILRFNHAGFTLRGF